MADKYHTPEYFRARRSLLRAERGLEPERDFVHHPRRVAAGRELQALMMAPLQDLAWPKSLYSDHPATIGELMAAPALQQRTPINSDALCKCGCGKEHRGNVAMTINSTHGHGFNVYYFYLEVCKTRYVRLNGRK